MIRLTKLTDYGIVLMTHMAREHQRDLFNARDLAHETRIPLPTVGRLLKVLTASTLLVSHRGAKGGYSLARPSDQISVADVVAAVEGPISLTECTERPLACIHEHHCPVRTNWHLINDAILDALGGVTLADMARPLGRDAWLKQLSEGIHRKVPVS
ncbi:MAG: SUF system Fe-S cluster assembly regulator [Candidatus Xenobia bacterium]